MTTLWVDVSHHDWDRRGGNLDWARVRAVTSPVMIARATYGDPAGWWRATRHFGDFQAAARDAGFVLRGGYHNLIRGDSASIARQVDFLRRELDAWGCNWAMADVEPYAELISANLWPRFEDVQRFHDRWYAVESRVLAWYIPRWFWSWRDKSPSLGEPDLRGLRGPLIQSHYAGGDGPAATIYANAGGDRGTGWDDVYGGRAPDIWQFTAGADVDGASTNTDANAYRGSLNQLTALLIGDTVGWTEVIEDELNPNRYTAGRIALGTNIYVTETLNLLKATSAEDATRDAATLAAVQALAIATGNDPTPVVEAIRVEAAATRALVEQTHQEEMAALRRNHEAEVAGLRAELAALTGGTGS